MGPHGKGAARDTLSGYPIMFFNIISEKGVFQPLINGLLKVAGNSVVGILVVTGGIALVAHMDGGGFFRPAAVVWREIERCVLQLKPPSNS
ncbi:hypothetical protein [Pseudomonas putida]